MKYVPVLLFLIIGVLIAGCASNQPSSDNQQTGFGENQQIADDGQPMGRNGGQRPDGMMRGNYSGRMMDNITDEQRRAMMEQRTQQMIEACNGMNVGDSCKVSGQRFEQNGTCTSRNNTVECVLPRPPQRMPGQ